MAIQDTAAANTAAAPITITDKIILPVHGMTCASCVARVEKGFMAKAVVPAAQKALADAGIAIGDCKAIKTHNPFAVNDILFARQTGADLMSMNNYGSSLIWGHPQGPTGMRAIIELIEELVLLGGGWGLFQGCAAGDTSMAAVIKVGK